MSNQASATSSVAVPAAVTQRRASARARSSPVTTSPSDSSASSPTHAVLHRTGPEPPGRHPASTSSHGSSARPATTRAALAHRCRRPDLIADHNRGIGYLLKERVSDVEEFVAALRRVAAGGTALDPEVVSQLLLRRRSDPLDRLTPREREVLGLMAEGRSNAGIAEALVVGDSAVAKHINSIFTKLDLSPADGDHRRVLAVLRFLASA